MFGRNWQIRAMERRDRQPEPRTSQLLDWISLGADSMKTDIFCTVYCFNKIWFCFSETKVEAVICLRFVYVLKHQNSMFWSLTEFFHNNIKVITDARLSKYLRNIKTTLPPLSPVLALDLMWIHSQGWIQRYSKYKYRSGKIFDLVLQCGIQNLSI